MSIIITDTVLVKQHYSVRKPVVIRLCVSVAVSLTVTSTWLLISNPLDEKKEKEKKKNYN